jgi:hypothetical protein
MWCNVVAITHERSRPMLEPAADRYSDTWHAVQAVEERAWLDDWIRGDICPTTLAACAPIEPAAAVPSLATTGSI